MFILGLLFHYTTHTDAHHHRILPDVSIASSHQHHLAQRRREIKVRRQNSSA
ncbi:hypothetical protein GE21DRAFT_1313092 [Neurospora crassa]|uniref:Uncharacterized protein n=3 Tax=Neurospora TaxID=5140 RepID=A0AAE0JL76_9PEZI|nr:uncharacterized protein NEUTE1DRAFT_93715 [Neurospora tetrasperma FGSC 2508]EGZ75349.1 hypothetical protein NEUTE2DRAFT_120292 [Neurospora tetrasperma FGSC 2509]KAK3351451.1 hypothetical protein B0H65DRAFT_420830 [Neurospora tetraspora]KAK3499777.1 hypothetical protein B0T23DRAFT_25441 [Neurospora hispaniola]KHE79226.1 hypothetical protein GE21DRAFT_1313092 [Neurospora crassa]EGO60669.1 hypothetical protein NEUTE1DRAFT_93715 [Neurospora tetrasperma FGSC 2508]